MQHLDPSALVDVFVPALQETMISASSPVVYFYIWHWLCPCEADQLD